MTVTVERAKLLEGVQKLQRAVGAKSTMPVLEGILISAEKGLITLSSYNLEIGMKKEMYAQCEKEGDIVINARLLADILRKMNSLQVEITADEKLLCHISGGGAVFDIMGMAATDYPEMPSVADGTRIEIDSKLFGKMVSGTIFSVAQVEGTRPILTGLDVSVSNGILQLVAVDGCRLAIRRERVAVEENIEFIAAGKAISEAVKLIDEETENISITVGKRLISFNIDGYLFISRLLEGEYVNYQKIIPAENKQTVVVNTRELINVIERVSLLINDFLTSPVRAYFDTNEVTFSCTTSMGHATEKMELALEGEPFEIGINSRLLLEALRAIDEEFVKIIFNGVNAGIVLCSPDSGNEDYLYIVMPMRLNNEKN